MANVPSISFLHHRLKLRQLELLVLLAEHGSLRVAAEQMSLTQSAASKMLHELEELLKLKLFERLPRGVQPTVYGEAVIRYARRVFLDMHGLHSQLVTLQSGELGHLRIGSIMAPAIGLLTRVVTLIKQRYGKISMSLQIDTSDILVNALQLDKLDVVLGRVPLGWDTDGLLVDATVEEPLSVVVGKAHPLASATRCTLRKTVSYPWVLQPYPSPMRAIIDRALNRVTSRLPAGVIETSSLLTTVALLQQEEFIAVLPGAIAEDYSKKQILSILPVRLGEELPPFGIIRRDTEMLHPTTKIFIDLVKENW